jgi:hypothetical protein
VVRALSGMSRLSAIVFLQKISKENIRPISIEKKFTVQSRQS